MKQKILLLALLLAIMAAKNFAQTTIGNLKYTFSGSNATVNGYVNKPSGHLTIPSTVTYRGKTYTVTKIGSDAFRACSSLTSISLTNVTSVEAAAFCESGLTSVSLPKVTEILTYAFYKCQSLTTVDMPQVKSIGMYAFDECTALTTVNMPNVQTIDSYAFDECTALTTVNMPNVQTIDSYAFAHCTALKHISALRKLKTVANHVFLYCPLTTVIMPLDVVALGFCAFWRDGFDGNPRTVFVIEDASTINKFENQLNRIFGWCSRLIVPTGKAALVCEKWNMGSSQDFTSVELYSPVPLAKSNDGYSTMVITEDNPAASFTYEGVTYENVYAFNFALSKEACYASPTYSGSEIFQDDYKYKWFAATGYKDCDGDVKEGILTITSPKYAAVMPVDKEYCIGVNKGFLLKGPSFTGEGDDIIYVPTWKKNLGRGVYTGTNYFKAGTGAAVAKESDGCRNFYFSASKQDFWPCNNTVIPKERAYLALPSSMTANAKQISFVIDDGEDEITGVISVDGGECRVNSYYTLDGRKLDGKPITKGIYIHNGRKEVIQ